jgi:hypothetical protein
MEMVEARSPLWRILTSSNLDNLIALDVLLAIDCVLLSSGKEPRMNHLPVMKKFSEINFRVLPLEKIGGNFPR